MLSNYRQLISVRGPLIAFAVVLLGISFYYGYHEILKKGPQSVHKWRQTDSATIALNYYQHGMKFFSPEVHGQYSDAGLSGYAAGEFPGLYYTVAALWKITGHSDPVYRGLNLFIFYCGLFALYRMGRKILGDSFWAAAIPVLLFCSPAVVYYANNFIPDVAAFSFSMIAWNFFVGYWLEKKNPKLAWSFLFFTLAGLLKVTSLISPLAILGVLLFREVFPRAFDAEIPRFSVRIVLTAALCFSVVAAWYLYAIRYNEHHQTGLFSTRTHPWWGMTNELKEYFYERLSKDGHRNYFHRSVYILLLGAFLSVLVFFRKSNRFFALNAVFLFFACCAIAVLWAYAFIDHDYYIINMLVLAVVILFGALLLLKDTAPAVYRFWPLKVAFTLFLAYNVHFAKERLTLRYEGWMNDYALYADVHQIQPYLRALGVAPGEKIISVPDWTPNYTLYLMNQKGWTEAFRKVDGETIELYKSLGAKYLIITDPKEKSRPEFVPYLRNFVGQSGSVSIYSL